MSDVLIYNCPVSLKLNPLQQVLLEVLAVNPSTNTKARIFYSDSLEAPVFSDGVGYFPLDARKATNIPLSALTVDPTARANHTGTQTASTISDFNTAVRTNRLDQLAVPLAHVSLGGMRLTNVAAPTVGTDAANMTWVQQASTTGNAGTATALQTARTIGLSGLVTSNAFSFDGTANITIVTDIADGAISQAKVTGLGLALSQKQDELGFTPVNKAGDTLTGYVQVHAIPVSDMQIAPKKYVDDAIQNSHSGLNVLDPVKITATTPITLAGLQVIDTYSIQAGDRVGVVDQAGDGTAHVDNGIYIAAAGAWVRASDADDGTLVPASIFVTEAGQSNKGSQWYLQNSATIDVGVTALDWKLFNRNDPWVIQDGLQQAGSQISVKPSTGITVSAAGVAIDASVVARKGSALLGDGASLVYVINHSLNTKALMFSLRNTVTDEFEMASIKATSDTSITVTFSPTAPLANQYELSFQG